jgi:hypothetical protein
MPSIVKTKTDEIDRLERKLHNLIKEYDPMFKTEVIRLKISNTFSVRARCKDCGKGPSYYYYTRKPFLYKNVRDYIRSSEWMRGYIKRMTSDWYLDATPRYFHGLEEFSFKIDDKSYLPAAHRIRGAASPKDNVTEIIGCVCGKTLWAFNQRSIQNRSEITNRKGRYSYPQRFEF